MKKISGREVVTATEAPESPPPPQNPRPRPLTTRVRPTPGKVRRAERCANPVIVRAERLSV